MTGRATAATATSVSTAAVRATVTVHSGSDSPPWSRATRKKPKAAAEATAMRMPVRSTERAVAVTRALSLARDEDDPHEREHDAEDLQGAGPLAARRAPEDGHESGAGDDRRDQAHVDEGQRAVLQDDAEAAGRAADRRRRQGAESRPRRSDDDDQGDAARAPRSPDRRARPSRRSSGVTRGRRGSRRCPTRSSRAERGRRPASGPRGGHSEGRDPRRIEKPVASAGLKVAECGRRPVPAQSRPAGGRGPRPRPPSCRRTSRCAARSRSRCWRCRRSCRGPR